MDHHRLLASCLAAVLSGCPASFAAIEVDAGMDAAPMRDSGPSCGCRTGAYRATGRGDGFTVDENFTVSECDGELVCTVRGESRRCPQTSEPALRVYLDRDGYVQLVFTDTPCGRPWTGSYATEGGGAAVTANLE